MSENVRPRNASYYELQRTFRPYKEQIRDVMNDDTRDEDERYENVESILREFCARV